MKAEAASALCHLSAYDCFVEASRHLLQARHSFLCSSSRSFKAPKMASSPAPLVTSQPQSESPSDTATSSGSEGKPGISWPLERPIHSGVFTQRVEEEVRRKSDTTAAAVGNPSKSTISHQDLLPGHKRSQSGIAARSFALGLTFGISVLLYFYLSFEKKSRLWRPWFFLAALSLFHFLEFWTHARYNLPNATISTFLLFTNGMAYNLAHTSAMIETILTSTVFPQWQSHVAYRWVQLLGFGLVVIGQIARTVAMVTASTNFHHHVQTKQRQGHELVKHGIYAWLRHPSYFGFFWWAVGTQLVLGNVLCFFVYVLVLWRFFFRRIKGRLIMVASAGTINAKLEIVEEKHLINFFGDDYVQYRAKTMVGIPFIP